MPKTRKSYPRKDLTGMRIGHLTPIEWIRGGFWKCKCDCGNETIVDTRNLTTGHTQSCGCARRETKNVFDMSGYEDENLRVISRSGNVGEIAAWKCICKHCGRTFTTKGSNIRNGATTSCGCVNSKNEQYITALLQENGIEFEAQYTFPDLVGVGGRRLRFDFAIFKNGELVRLVEFNGSQHYERPEGSWANQYDILVENDRRKAEYCREHHIELRIIKYSDRYDLSDIIE